MLISATIPTSLKVRIYIFTGLVSVLIQRITINTNYHDKVNYKLAVNILLHVLWMTEGVGRQTEAPGTETLTTRWIAPLYFFGVHDDILIKFNHWLAALFQETCTCIYPFHDSHLLISGRWLRFTFMEDKIILFHIDNIVADYHQWPLLLTWINFNPCMDK